MFWNAQKNEFRFLFAFDVWFLFVLELTLFQHAILNSL